MKIFWKLSLPAFLTALVLLGGCVKHPRHAVDGVYLIYKDGHEVVQLIELSPNEDWTLTSSKGTVKHSSTTRDTQWKFPTPPPEGKKEIIFHENYLIFQTPTP